jgi:hypothetical protein
MSILSTLRYDEARVEDVAQFIAKELIALIDRRNANGHLSKRIREACPSYQNGLTNGERVVATLRALALVQIEATKDATTLWDDVCDCGCLIDDEAA